MWLCGLNAKCLLSKPFPADSWAQRESRAGPSCYYICPMSCQPQPCTPSSTVSHYRWTGAWLNVFYGILTFHTDLHISYFILLLAETFFWVSAAGHLLVSVGWGCRSPPVLEILRLQPRLHLLRQSLHAIVVTLEDWEGQPLFLMFSISPALILLFPPSTTMCSTGHRHSSWTVMLYSPCFSWQGPSCKQRCCKRGEEHGTCRRHTVPA